jgi:predicted N-acetyltransferase YhbS
MIRSEIEKDYQKITKINDLAFEGTSEGILIKKLRNTPSFNPEFSFVAEINNELVGHIIFYPIKIISDKKSFVSISLGPMAVIPNFQRKGIGTALVKKGLEKEKKLGFESVIVLGHAEYYPRFGFKPASKWNIKSPYDVPDNVFLALELVPGALKNVSGIVKYPKEFDEV